MITAYLGFGANLGDREAALQGGLAVLERLPGLGVTAVSALYETEPVGGPPGQGDFLNAVVQMATQLTPRELLHACQSAEYRFGRQRRQKWGPRTLDIDLLFFGEEIVSEEDLVIPHPRLHLRSFVLEPLLDLAPELHHPVLGKSIRQLHARLSGGHGVRRVSDRW